MIRKQFRAIGWRHGRRCSAIFEIRHDSEGEYHYPVTAWRANKEEEQAMPKTSKTKCMADDIADTASPSDDVSAHFANKFTVVRPVRRVNVDLTQGMMRELDERTARLNVTRQAVIKTLLGRALSEERAVRFILPKRQAGAPEDGIGLACRMILDGLGDPRQAGPRDRSRWYK